ncbi:MAG: hypothetical protein JJ992_11215, partial [Planctomycetes bacterium]|nr:hypothetical protein [Planctomycetota bacterium]
MSQTTLAGDAIANFGGVAGAMQFKGAIDGATYPFPVLATRKTGWTYTITASSPVTDPDTAQTFQPGDEIVWDEANGWW